MTALVETDVQSGRGTNARPLLFLHVPKTAGTSFILTLQNLFGDRRVTRLDFNEPGFESAIERYASGAEAGLACLTGHIPAQFFAAHWNRFMPFTMLRHPVRRILSLYRFLKTTLRTPEQLEEHGLAPGFGFEDFMSCRHPRVYVQTHNGIVRFLCGHAAANDPAAEGFWSMQQHPEFLFAALELLEGISFGVTEHMDETISIIRSSFNIPFDVEITRENETKSDGTEKNAAHIQNIVEKNSLDIALYERAAVLFQERFRSRYNLGTSAPSVIFRPTPGVATPLDLVEGRQGFHEYESGGFAWLGPAGRGVIYFASPPVPCHVSVKIYSITMDYPVNRLTIRIDGKEVPFDIEARKSNWNDVTTSNFIPSGKITKLEIISPYNIPVEYISPSSKDKRHLSVAISSILFSL